MPFPKGGTHSPETRRKIGAAHKGIPHSDERKKKISEANSGKVREKKHNYTCPCGLNFQSASPFARFCSRRCSKAARGHGLMHAPEFSRFARQCAICEATDQLVGDHDHDSGEPRGILCRNCNLAIGNMFDSPARLRAAADYLEK